MTVRPRLHTAGWNVGYIIDLGAEEAAIVTVRVGLAQLLRELRVERALSQAKLARLIRSSRLRVARMEEADRSVSIDSLVRTLLA
jgi:predicted transcriptional regulator